MRPLVRKLLLGASFGIFADMRASIRKTLTLAVIGLGFLTVAKVTLSRHGAKQSALPPFNQYQNLAVRKMAFVDYLLPIANRINQHILHTRSKIIRLFNQTTPLRTTEKTWLTRIAHQYGLKTFALDAWQDRVALLNRVDVVPNSLLLAQAANESAWGTSRFAQQGNNLFGQWCFKKGCGIVPRQRPQGANYEVKVFNSPQASVNAYIHNLNTNHHYRYFRQLRLAERNQYQSLNGASLAEGLGRYSQLGTRYITMLQTIISHNRLAQYDRKLPSSR